jgi:hypothetical protein
MPQPADRVFVSYSHKDGEWLERLQTMLKPLVRKKLAVWDDTKIRAGAKWKDEIEGALAAAKVAVLLVSPDFLDSDFIAKHELPPLLEAAEKQGLVILWVYVSSCLYDETEIKDYQAAHNISKPLDSLQPHEQNAVLADVCRKIKAAANPSDTEASIGYHFLSYSRVDAVPFAIELRCVLASGSPSFSILTDERSDEEREIVSEQSRDQQLDDAIRSSQSLLFVMSRESVTDRSVCHLELTSALKYKKPILPVRLHADAAMPPLRGSRQYLDFCQQSEFNASLARLRNHLDWLASPAGVLRSFKDRLDDAERDLVCARDQIDRKRIEVEIKLLKEQVAEQQKIVDSPREAQERANKSIASGLENERLGSQPISPAIAKFINPPPGVAPSYFQDRVIETQLVGNFLKDDTKRLLRIVGRSGVGKTAMVCRVLDSLEDGRLPEPESEPLAIDAIVYGSKPITLRALFADLVQLLPDEPARKLGGIYKNPQATVEMKTKALVAAFPKGRFASYSIVSKMSSIPIRRLSATWNWQRRYKRFCGWRAMGLS